MIKPAESPEAEAEAERLKEIGNKHLKDKNFESVWKILTNKKN